MVRLDFTRFSWLWQIIDVLHPGRANVSKVSFVLEASFLFGAGLVGLQFLGDV
jgi:hypothetical protein